MKAIVSNELKKRLEFASKNGSVVAKEILNELKKDIKDIFGDKTANYFDSVRVVGDNSNYKSLYIKISLCSKDLNNEHFPDKGNPRAARFSENRERVTVGSFVSLFKNLEGKYKPNELDYFYSSLCVNDVVKYRISNKMEDFERAYCGINYYPFGTSGSPLHNSCMRYDDTARNAADFYANFAGARIIIAEDSQNQILGRAIVWDNVCIPEVFDSTNVLDRIYFCFDFVRIGIMEYAYKLGINIRKAKNTYDSKMDFFCYPESTYNGNQYWCAHIVVPQIKWHKRGCPYLDTFSYLSISGGNIILSNSPCKGTVLAKLNSTQGYGSIERHICPICGSISYCDVLCDDCEKKVFEKTTFGNVFKCKTRMYKGKKYPILLFDNGKPSKTFLNWIGIQRICNPAFKL